MKILFTPYGGGSIAHIVRSLAVAEELKLRGHEILFTAPSNKKSLIQKAGFAIFGDGHPEVNLNDEKDQSINYFKDNREKFIAWLADEVAAAEYFKPDIIVNSPTFFGAQVSEKLGIPHVTIINSQWLDEHKGVLGLSLSTNRLHHRILRRIAAPIFAKKFVQLYMGEIHEFYKALGIENLPKIRHDLHKKHPAIIPSLPSFEPLKRNSRGDIYFVGPLQWNGFEKDPFDLKKLFPNYKKHPLVYVTLGGSIFRKESYDELIDGLLKKTGWNIILSIGPNFDRSLFPKDTNHLKIVTYAPGMAVCEHADIVINTGGHGTVMQALWFGKPVIAIPHNIDQGTIAARLKELGIGINLNPISIRDFTHRDEYFKKATKVSASTILSTTEKALKNTRLRDKAAKYGVTVQVFGAGHARAADIIEEHARKNRR